MSKRWSKYDAPYSKCDKCGWTGHDWSFKYQGLCSNCYKKWKNERSEALRTLKPPNDNLEITKGLVVTRNVQKRLIKQSQSDIPPVKHYELMDWFVIIVPIIVALLLFLANSHPGLFIGVPILIAIAIFIAVKKNKKLNERMMTVNAHVEELARERKRRIEEAKLFYSSPEWRLIREKVIKQQGSVCQECGQPIKNVFDITVDHIKPRSLFSQEALMLNNLRVLCRSCNSKKGDNIINESDILIGTQD